MHESLDLRNISRLPISIRKLATAAADGSLKHLELLCASADRGPEDHALLLLPVFINLDLAKIPTIDELAEKFSVAEIMDATTRGKICISYLHFLHEIPSETFPTLFPRVWKWLSFIDTQPYSKPNINNEGFNEDILLPFLLVARVHINPGTRKLVHSTPGMGVVVVKIWKMSLQPGNRILANGAFMAANIRQHSVLDALVDDGLSSALTNALSVLEQFTKDVTPVVIEKCFTILDWSVHVDMKQFQRIWRPAFWTSFSRAGTTTVRTIECLQKLLAVIFPSYTVYYSILCRTKASFHETSPHVPSGRSCGSRNSLFRGTNLSSCELTVQRVYTTARKNAKHSFGEKVVIGNFAGIFVNSVSRDSPTTHLGENESMLTTRDRSFMRVLLHHDYQSARAEVFLGQIVSLNQNPGEDFFTLFDYTNGHVSIKVLPATSSIGCTASHFSNFVWRKNQSAGRMESHFMLVGQSSSSTLRIIPMRSTTSRVRDELNRIARSRIWRDEIIRN
ncbi:hypothetical protein C8R44DRAFT_726413 [Mycena epipterygia]|nr:hypothetical protein C8R44DRAFT_726413 [Mycena epipterygia]